ncbi:MAG: hypothetical protein JSV37_01490 [Anaerolineaceae bacterium]|nr:MAG: hypothetical protein JSV37_01490 [Anaerolineaceae bacterium]
MENDTSTRPRKPETIRSSSFGIPSEKIIRKALRSDALQHPATIIPLASCLLSTIYIVLYAPIFGGSEIAYVLIISSGLTATGSFLWRYFIRFNEEYVKKTQELLDALDREGGARYRTELRQTRERLQIGFLDANFSEGLKAIQALVHEYKHLQPILISRRLSDPLSFAHIPVLVEETYQLGLGVLGHALELVKTIQSPRNQRLRTEITNLENEILSLDEGDPHSARAQIKEQILISHKERIELIGRLELRVDELLHQANRCEATLHQTRIELAALKADSVETSVSEVIQTLQQTIRQAKEVQDELKKLEQ